MNEDQQQYSSEYTEDGFWEKTKNVAKKAGESVLGSALKLYYASDDPETPVWAKTTIYGALGYFIMPIDVIADVVPGIGYTDDIGVLTAAIAATAAHIKDEHVEKAKKTLAQWFD